jgi:hypothetical protein
MWTLAQRYGISDVGLAKPAGFRDSNESNDKGLGRRVSAKLSVQTTEAESDTGRVIFCGQDLLSDGWMFEESAHIMLGTQA